MAATCLDCGERPAPAARRLARWCPRCGAPLPDRLDSPRPDRRGAPAPDRTAGPDAPRAAPRPGAWALLALAIVASAVGLAVSVGRSHLDDPEPSDAVEVPRAGLAAPASEPDDSGEPATDQPAPRQEPACTGARGEPCGVPLLHDTDAAVLDVAVSEDGRIYVVRSDGVLLAFRRTGALHWRTSVLTGAQLLADVRLVTSGELVLVVTPHEVLALDRTQLVRRWRSPLPATTPVGLGTEVDAMAAGDDTLLVHLVDAGEVAALELATGGLRWWMVLADAEVALTPDGVVVVDGARLTLFPADGGDPRWEVVLPSDQLAPVPPGVDTRPGDPLLLTGPRQVAVVLDVTEGSLLLGDETVTGAAVTRDLALVQVSDPDGGPAELRAIGTDGAVRWVQDTTGRCCPPTMVVDAGRSRLAVSGPGLQAALLLDLTDGSVLGLVHPPPEPGHVVALAPSMAVVEVAGTLTGMSLEDGTVRWQTVRGARLVSADPLIVEARGQLYLIERSPPFGPRRPRVGAWTLPLP